MGNWKDRKVVLLIMDGWGLAPDHEYNAIANAKTPIIDKLTREYPNTRLKSDGLAVGLPEGQFGTSEVNHLTIGAGRIILQDLPRINKAIETEEFYSNAALVKMADHAEQNNSKLHLMGIYSDGGVHSHLKHVEAIFELLKRREFKQPVSLHLFSDGRDVAPKSLEGYFSELDKTIAKYSELNIRITTLQGRYFLDRDRDWEKTETAFKLITKGEGQKVRSWEAAKNLAYRQVNSDEYFKQYLVDPDDKAKDYLLGNNDAMFVFHYRTDRIYQIIHRILEEEFKNFAIGAFVNASEEFTQLQVAFPRLEVNDTLAETLSKAERSQLHVTETEKFAHLTYFLNGERESEYPHEEWKMFESNRFIKPLYNFEPSMRNFEIAKAVIDSINASKHDFVVANFSSPDMVGHTGNYEAAVVSAESVDYCVGKIYEAVQEKLDEYVLLVTADHGNSDKMWDEENNQPHTQHTTSPVPFIVVSNLDCKLDPRESLQDIAPTVLDLMNIDKPAAMTGDTLIISK
jgi:2,3-bisphosphoglycerate-independent phosphoglycerate mutase